VKIGGELYSDAMGQPGEHPGYEVHTYEGMFRYNVDTIVKALK
jgi:manganese/zinc/iron transport system substrate-binding protein